MFLYILGENYYIIKWNSKEDCGVNEPMTGRVSISKTEIYIHILEQLIDSSESYFTFDMVFYSVDMIHSSQF